jgi:hypothetical protein
MADEADDQIDKEEENIVQKKEDGKNRLVGDGGNDDKVSVSDSSLSDDVSLLDESSDDESVDCSVETVEEDAVPPKQSFPCDINLSASQENYEEENTAKIKPLEIQLERGQSTKLEIHVQAPSETTSPVAGVNKVAYFDAMDEREGKHSRQTPPNELSTSKPRRNNSARKSNGEEARTEIAPEVESDPPAETEKNSDPDRGNLIRRVSSSFRNVGRNASFKESFRKIGKTASKLRQISRRKVKKPDEDLPDGSPSQPNFKEVEHDAP